LSGGITGSASSVPASSMPSGKGMYRLGRPDVARRGNSLRSWESEGLCALGQAVESPVARM